MWLRSDITMNVPKMVIRVGGRRGDVSSSSSIPGVQMVKKARVTIMWKDNVSLGAGRIWYWFLGLVRCQRFCFGSCGPS